jgi:hypothetical protein
LLSLTEQSNRKASGHTQLRSIVRLSLIRVSVGEDDLKFKIKLNLVYFTGSVILLFICERINNKPEIACR